ncbi:hypothetical protein EB118_09305 [bacterium]|nr:hypothetical protein [bacterium]
MQPTGGQAVGRLDEAPRVEVAREPGQVGVEDAGVHVDPGRAHELEHCGEGDQSLVRGKELDLLTRPGPEVDLEGSPRSGQCE